MLLRKRPSLFIISGPSGCGKTTVANKMIELFQGKVSRVITCTTRAPRLGEIEGKDYQFLSVKAFEEKKERGEFLEWTQTYHYYYGILKKSLQSLERQTLLVVDVKGALAIVEQLKAISIFMLPPSLEELKRRLFRRKNIDVFEVENRLKRAEEEIKLSRFYDYVFINKDLKETYKLMESILIAESLKRESAWID